MAEATERDWTEARALYTEACELKRGEDVLPMLAAALAAARREARETIARHFEAQAEQALAGKKLVGRFARAEELRAVAAEIREVEV